MEPFPVLYSYRRCPYAMRARMSIVAAGEQRALKVEQREIVFWDKPADMLAASPKGTVPVLVLPSGEVIEESLDIMLWALTQGKGAYQIAGGDARLPEHAEAMQLIRQCDDEFKVHLDHYKYADRFPEASQTVYRTQGEEFLEQLEALLVKGQSVEMIASDSIKQPGLPGLLHGQSSFVDLAIFPFVRQFAHVDKTWFAAAHYPCLRAWLAAYMDSDMFKSVMKNRPVWESNHAPLWVDEPELQTKDQFRVKALSNAE
ncbi:MAG: glutathione S-transferase [Gammaproteobacteria bacterium]|nr:glutathione S-transferase [Gammaproteobacteria bacterium]